MILHTFNSIKALQVCSLFVQEDDQVLFIEDGVYCLLNENVPVNSSNLHALEADINSRGLAERIDSRINRISYETFVQLCCEADSVSNWF